MTLSNLEYLAEVRKELTRRGLVEDLESEYFNFCGVTLDDNEEEIKDTPEVLEQKQEAWKDFTQSNDITTIDYMAGCYDKEDWRDILERLKGHLIYIDVVPIEEFTQYLLKDLGSIKSEVQFTSNMGNLDGFIE